MIKSRLAGLPGARRRFWVVALFAILAFSVSAHAQHPFRTLSGRVSDGREPLQGAVVLLRQESTDSIQSYITDGDGHYHFLRLDPEGDYSVWATFRGRRARAKSISRFDRHLAKAVDLVIRNR